MVSKRGNRDRLAREELVEWERGKLRNDWKTMLRMVWQVVIRQHGVVSL